FDQRFSSFELTLQGTSAKISNVKYTDEYRGDLESEKKDEEDLLAKGVGDDGKTPMSADETARTSKLIGDLANILSAGPKQSLAFEGTIQPYKRKPKRPTVQYPLSIKTNGLDEKTLWDTLGNEGTGARLLLPASADPRKLGMLSGKPGNPD